MFSQEQFIRGRSKETPQKKENNFLKNVSQDTSSLPANQIVV